MYDLDSFIEDSPGTFLELPLRDANVIYYPYFLSSPTSDKLFKHFLEETPWQQDEITLFGKTHLQPRLTALYGNNGKSYSYSGICMRPLPFQSSHKELLKKLKEIETMDFSTVLLNLYRNGQDSNGWHSDDEKELGKNPVIASLSFGADRIFHLKHKNLKKERYKLTLRHGSLLLMKGATQHNWKHQLPKSNRIHDPRINLTFRKIE